MSFGRPASGMPVLRAVAALHPKPLLAWERNRDRFRISHACRTVEIAHGYKHDHGLYMARVHPGQATTIELATVAERMAWKAKRQQDRVEERVRRDPRRLHVGCILGGIRCPLDRKTLWRQ